MKWRQVDDHHAVSDCGRYKVCRVTVWGQLWFEAYFGRECIGREAGVNSAVMREVCAQHAAALPAPEVSFAAIAPQEGMER